MLRKLTRKRHMMMTASVDSDELVSVATYAASGVKLVL